jgi:hypothetical protein
MLEMISEGEIGKAERGEIYLENFSPECTAASSKKTSCIMIL